MGLAIYSLCVSVGNIIYGQMNICPTSYFVLFVLCVYVWLVSV
jgi:hypothetical protein